MGDKELKEMLEGMERLRRELSGSREKALAFLMEAGIVTAEGQLTEQYTQMPESA